MRVPKILIVGTLCVVSFGAARSIAANADFANDNGNDLTVPYAYAAASTNSFASSSIYVVNPITGDEMRVPPVDRPRPSWRSSNPVPYGLIFFDPKPRT
jgi:hypothetical protein